MSGQWQFFAFDAHALATHVLDPIQLAIRNRDIGAWRSILGRLNQVYPRTRLWRGGFNACDRPITALSWYQGFEDLSLDDVPEAESESVVALCRAALDAFSPLHLVSRELRPGHLFRDLAGVIEPRGDEEEEFALLLQEVFSYQDSIPEPFAFLDTRDVWSTYASPQTVAHIAEVIAQNGYLLRAAGALRTNRAQFSSDLVSLSHFIGLAAAEGCAVHYYE